MYVIIVIFWHGFPTEVCDMNKVEDSTDPTPLIDAARSLRDLLGSHSIREVSQTRLARHSREVMSEMLESNAFLRVQIGTRAMMVVDDEFFERASRLLESVESRLQEMDPVLEELRGRFDQLSQRMNEPGARQATYDALFSERSPENLRENHRPGHTEKQP
jgi:hypothetical protein